MNATEIQSASPVIILAENVIIIISVRNAIPAQNVHRCVLIAEKNVRPAAPVFVLGAKPAKIAMMERHVRAVIKPA